MFKKSISTLLMAVFAVFMIASCSGGGGGSSGNTISGSVSLSSGSVNASVSRTALEGDTDSVTGDGSETTGDPYVGATVQLIWVAEDGTETVVDETTTDEDGNFTFENVAEGTYEIAIIDSDTGEEVTRAPLPLVDGDDITVDGAVSTDGTDWTIDFGADEGSDEALELQNEEQTSKIQNLALAAGVDESEVFDMRTEEKMGWGKIAKLLGVHPSVLGLGYVDSDADGEEDGFETEITTSTNEESIGESSGASDGDSDSKGGGKGKPDKPGNGNGNSGNNGNGNGNGNGKPKK